MDSRRRGGVILPGRDTNGDGTMAHLPPWKILPDKGYVHRSWKHAESPSRMPAVVRLTRGCGCGRGLFFFFPFLTEASG